TTRPSSGVRTRKRTTLPTALPSHRRQSSDAATFGAQRLAIGDFHQLRGVIEREDAAIGVFITLEPATKDMRKEAADAGFWQTKTLAGTKHPRLQILTIEELLAGKKIDMPAQQDIRSFKQAPKRAGGRRQMTRICLSGTDEPWRAASFRSVSNVRPESTTRRRV